MAGPEASSSDRRAHVREQTEQVLFTMPGERVFRHEFGAGVQRLLFEPNAPTLWELTKKRLTASLIEALKGEVDPRTLDVEVRSLESAGGAGGEVLGIRVSYQLAALGGREEHSFQLESAGG
jgi:phage baseplate assembly protein W